jgi:hypothetical protein
MKSEKKKTNEQEIMENYVIEASENTMLRAHSRHSMKLGNVELDIVPTDKTQSLEDVMKQFAKFAKLMQKLHGNAHLSFEEGLSHPPSGMFE